LRDDEHIEEVVQGLGQDLEQLGVSLQEQEAVATHDRSADADYAGELAAQLQRGLEQMGIETGVDTEPGKRASAPAPFIPKHPSKPSRPAGQPPERRELHRVRRFKPLLSQKRELITPKKKREE